MGKGLAFSPRVEKHKKTGDEAGRVPHLILKDSEEKADREKKEISAS